MDYVNNKFDIIVVGAGHAGCEAAHAAAAAGRSAGEVNEDHHTDDFSGDVCSSA